MSKPATSRLERIALAVVIPGYVLMVLLFASLSWTMADERRRVEAGPTISAIVGPTYAIKGRTMGEVSYSIASSSGRVECRDEIELGPTDLKFQSGQAIDIVAGDRCGRAVSIHKRLSPLSYLLMAIGAVLGPIANLVWEKRKHGRATSSPSGARHQP
ncbi:hypothetical protein ACQVP2_08315 [Methylobacterium aquaticum]|uniref:DUF3592 domain-containing protein n=1 Tax=Methylobacterium aquaticum TaxID=270351 RepID=A0A0J6RXB8_9HYPH|nr:hypothetical protein [Methylobacterium aquaticum]KMO27485.1 hypothetical protein VP06_30515 [Methylobacterium aquaticum]